MTAYNFSVHVNGTDTSSPNVGLAVGLTFFFVLLVVGTGVIVYKFHSKMRNMLSFGKRKSQKRKNHEETSEEDSNRYTSMTKEEPTGQQPIYVNLTTTREQSRPSVKRRSPIEPEEDVYLQCDSPDDAIYNNDPACHLSIHQEEDVYIIPES